MIRRAVVCALMCALAACGSSRSSTEGVALLVFGEPQEAEAYRTVIAEFQSMNPDRQVELIVASTRSDLLTRVSTSIAAGSPPDLFLVNYRFFGQYAARGALEPMTARLASSDELDADDFYAEPLAAFTWDREQMCLPQNVSSLAVYYNEDLFRAAGLDPPPDQWSWGEMVDAAAGLTRDVDGDGVIDQYGLGVDPGIIRLAPFVWSAGGTLFDDPERPSLFELDGRSTTAIQRFLNLRQAHGVVPTDEEVESESLESRFLNGRLAMMMSSRRSVPTLRSIESFSWNVAPIPTMVVPANVLHSDAFCMTADSGSHDAAWEFVEFALSERGQRVLAATGRTVPSRRSVAESPAFLDPSLPPTRSAVFLEAIPHVRRLPSISTWPEVEDLADVLIEEAMYDPAGGEAGELVFALRTETLQAFERAEP